MDYTEYRNDQYQSYKDQYDAGVRAYEALPEREYVIVIDAIVMAKTEEDAEYLSKKVIENLRNSELKRVRIIDIDTYERDQNLLSAAKLTELEEQVKLMKGQLV